MEKLFTTEDGMDIFEGDMYYSVNTVSIITYLGIYTPRLTIVGPHENSDATNPNCYFKFFSTKYSAQKFIMNSPGSLI
jgi:hypothetical protein